MTLDISIIIPTYNVENYIEKALNSIAQQTFKGKIEVIVVDDCSKDGTINKVLQFKDNHTEIPLKLLKQEKNMRQGTARNRGMMEAQGKYILFLDGDDFLDAHALEKMFNIAEKHNCDFVLCDWIYYYEDKGYVYVNHDNFLFQDFLIGEEVEQLLAAETYFTVNKLYRKEFLERNNIKYGEGYIYEDFEFYVQVAQHANKVGVVQNPFYKVRVNKHSTTKTNKNGTLHVESLLKAIENTLNKFNPRSEYGYYHVYKYLMKKSLTYLDTRAPRKYKKKTLKKVIDLLNNKNTSYAVPKNVVPLYNFLFRWKFVQNGKVNRILFVWYLQKKGYLRPLFKLLLKIKGFLKNSWFTKKIILKRRNLKIKSFYKKPILNDTILFLGFDYRYTGNSKYLFDYLKENSDLKLYFVTNNEEVPKQYRIRPRSYEFYEKLARSKIVIAESWVPLAFKKREGTIWIQLWHGTPFKKLLFDSHEYYISKLNKNHKKNKYKDIKKWDYLLADSKAGVEKLASAFHFDSHKILNYGYPRVQWLKDHKNNQGLKNKIKEKLAIPLEKTVILYAPTWRDYNYKTENLDLTYLLDVQKLEKSLNDDYVIVYKEHSLGKKKMFEGNIVIPDDDIETQELILISDLVISDYSSIIFDALAIDIPFYLFITDFEKYEMARGVYEDMHQHLSPFYVNNEMDLCDKILNIDKTYPFDLYNKVKEIYAFYDDTKNAYELLEEKIYEIINKN